MLGCKKMTDYQTYWIKLVTGEEIVSLAKIVDEGMHLVEPTMTSHVKGQIVLAPFALGCAEPSMMVKHTGIVWYSLASDIISKFYETSRTLRTRSDAIFNGIIEDAHEIVSYAVADREPTDRELDEIAEVQEFEDDRIYSSEEMSLRDRINNLVKLAEMAGKGKNGQKS
jgi:hypothetical protein